MKKTKLLVGIPTAIFYVGTIATLVVNWQRQFSYGSATIFLVAVGALIGTIWWGKPWTIVIEKDPYNSLINWSIALFVAAIAFIVFGACLFAAPFAIEFLGYGRNLPKGGNLAYWLCLATGTAVVVVQFFFEGAINRTAYFERQALYSH